MNIIIQNFKYLEVTNERDLLFNHLRKNNIIAGKHFQNANLWVKAYKYQDGDCPLFESKLNTILAIPCHYGISKTELNKMITFLLHFQK